LSLVSAASAAPPAVLQRGYDASVTGANLAETTLTTSNVGPNTFGLLFKLPVDDVIFAQPLYVPNVSIPNQGSHNVVYVATMGDSVYAFDADTGGAPLWHVNLATLVGGQVVPIAGFTHMGNKNIVGNLGVLSTPVIDPVTNIMYVVACTLEGGTMVYRLHALDITTGAEPLGAGVPITGSTNRPDFVPAQQIQRLSLVLAAGQVVIGFSAIELESATQVYSGWVMAYNETTLQQSGVFATLNNGNGAGVWQSGRPPVVDSTGNVFLFTGNGYSGTGYDGINNFSESALKLDAAHGLALVDWFTPSNWSAMDSSDQDLSSSGPLMIPGSSPPVLAGGGKTTYIYLLNSTNLGKNNPVATGDTQIIQKLNISNSEFRGGPVYWQRSNKSPLLYNWAASDWAKAYAFNGTTLGTTPSDQQPGSVRQQWPGGIMALSANGEQAGTGILWATVTTGSNNENNPPTAGELRALDASNLAAPTDLWNSAMNATRDGYGNFAKFVPPVVVNGKVYVATWSSQVAVYGLLSSFTVLPAPVTFALQSTNVASAAAAVTVTNTGTIALPFTSIAIGGAGASQFAQTNTCGTSIAVSASCTINVVFNPTAPGASTATLSVNTSAGAGTQSITLNGSAATPAFVLAPAALDFGSQATTAASAAQPAMLTNTGTVALPLTSLTITGANATVYSQSNACAATIAVGAACTVNVVFKPTAAGATTASLNVNIANGAATQAVALTGTGVTPSYTAAPTTLAFGVQSTAAASTPLSITVTNTGTIAVPITSILVQGANPAVFSQTNTCAGTVAVGGACTVNVVFTPTAVGAATATLHINVAGGVASQSISLSGTGAVPLYTVAPASVDFGTQRTTTASAPVRLTVSNTGLLVLPIAGIALAGANANQFSQSNTCSSSLAVGANCTVNLVFAPSVPGVDSATLNVNGGGGAAAQSVALTGTGATPTYTVSPGTLTFGSQDAGSTSAPQTITITNTGSILVPVNSIVLTGAGAAQFSQTANCPSTLAPGASCTVQVRFVPATAGSQSAQLTVSSVPSSHAVDLTGTATILATLTSSAATTLIATPVTLTWSAPGATCSATGGSAADGWTGSLPASGSRAVTESAAGSYDYGLTCSGGGQSSQAHVTVGVGAPSVALALAAGGATTGEAFTLNWSSTFSNTCTASGGKPGDGWAGGRATSGSASVTEGSSGSYTFVMTCGTGSQTAQATAVVTVSAPSSGGSGGGAMDYWTLATLLGLVGLHRARARGERLRASPRSIGSRAA
jgi:hypothetical protein